MCDPPYGVGVFRISSFGVERERLQPALSEMQARLISQVCQQMIHSVAPYVCVFWRRSTGQSGMG